MCDKNENYMGGIIEERRKEHRLSMVDLYSGICSRSVYNKIIGGENAGGIHVLRAICERLGINSDRCGTFIASSEYDDIMERLRILEDIKEGRLDRARECIAGYAERYKDNPLDCQFTAFMRGRLAELEGNNTEALEYYENAIHQTMPGYESRKKIPCLALHEAYMILGVARIKAKLGDEAEAYSRYELLMRYYTDSDMEKWNLVCIYPKLVCELIDIIGIDKMGMRGVNDMLEHCEKALGMLVDTARLYYIRPLLRNIICFKRRLGSDEESIRDYEDILQAVEKLFKKYGHENELFEWYPYYVGCGIYCVNEFIAERRIMHGMSIEALAGHNYSARNVQRIIKRQVAPSYNTSKGLLEKLGLKGFIRSDVIVGRNIGAYKLWDELELCIKKQDSERADSIIEQLECELDYTEKVNDIALKYIRLYWDFREDKITASDMMVELEKLLPFSVDQIGKYKILAKHEKAIIYDYIVCMDMLKKYDSIIDFERLTVDMQDSLSKKRFANCFEGVCVRYANLYGNAGNFDMSNKIAEEGISVDIECERMRPLSTLLYCIAWNNGKRGEVTENDIDLCRCAYQIAKLNGNEKRMDIYKKWLENR